MVEEGVDSSNVGPTDGWIEGFEIRYLEPMKIWRVVTQSQIEGDIDPHSAVIRFLGNHSQSQNIRIGLHRWWVDL